MEQAQLKILSGPLKGQAFPLIRRSIEIGRGSSCDIKPQGYDELGRHHARLTWENDGFQVVDLGSLNGVKVDGERVATHRLRSGSKVQFGDLVTELWIPPGGPTFQDAPAPDSVVPPMPAPRPTSLSPALIGACALAGLILVIVIAGAAGVFRPTGGGTGVSGGLSPDVLAATKASTVLVWTPIPGTDLAQTGTGFCALHKNWIITNAHVVLIPTVEDGQVVRGLGETSIIINSGTDDEKVVKGVVIQVTKNFDDDPDHDLAVIRIDDTSLNPLPIGAAEALHETQKCYAFGFPAVQTKDIRQGYPAMSVQDVSIEALRRDDADHLVKIQMGGTITHGNSGGPVINADGAVVGVVRELAREDGTPGDAYAIPSPFVEDLEKEIDQ